MSAFDEVAVTTAADSDPDNNIFAEGNVTFVPSGTHWPDGLGNPIVPPVIHGTLHDGTVTNNLIASDNFDSGVLTWNILINLRGMPTINVPDCVVNHADGASQNVWDILDANGWVPLDQP